MSNGPASGVERSADGIAECTAECSEEGAASGRFGVGPCKATSAVGSDGGAGSLPSASAVSRGGSRCDGNHQTPSAVEASISMARLAAGADSGAFGWGWGWGWGGVRAGAGVRVRVGVGVI